MELDIKKNIIITVTSSPYNYQILCAKHLENILLQMGYNAKILLISSDDTLGQVKQSLTQLSPNLVITFDMAGFTTELQEDNLFINRLFCPFINFIFNTPIYMSKMLSRRMNFTFSFYTLCDEYTDYIHSYYKNVPLVETCPQNIFNLKVEDIYASMISSNTSIQNIDSQINSLPDVFSSIVDKLYKERVTNSIYLHDFLENYFQKINVTLSRDELLNFTSVALLADQKRLLPNVSPIISSIFNDNLKDYLTYLLAENEPK